MVGLTLVTRNRSNEIQALSTSVGHLIGSAEIRKVRHQRVAPHLHRVIARHIDSPPSQGMHHVYVYRIVTVLQGLFYKSSLASLTLQLLGAGGASRQHCHNHRDYHQTLFHRVSGFKFQVIVIVNVIIDVIVIPLASAEWHAYQRV